jgi:methionine--tRNA ligase beta chain
MISFDDFKKTEIRIGKVVSAERVPDTDKLLKLSVDIGEETPRQIISGIAQYCAPENLVGRLFPFVTNLEPRTIRGLESEGMILGVSGKDGGSFSLLSPIDAVPAGSALG